MLAQAELEPWYPIPTVTSRRRYGRACPAAASFLLPNLSKASAQLERLHCNHPMEGSSGLTAEWWWGWDIGDMGERFQRGKTRTANYMSLSQEQESAKGDLEDSR